MAILFRQIIEYMEKLADPKLAEDYDNVGIMLGSKDKEVKRILVCLNVSDEIVDHAVKNDVQMILSHHPLIFKKMACINTDTPKGRIIAKLLNNGICVYSAHTNLDAAEGGINDMLAFELELKDTMRFRHSNDPSAPLLARAGSLKTGMSLVEFISFVKTRLKTKYVRVIGGHDNMVINRAAVFCGSFDGDLQLYKDSGAQVLVTGDVKYHDALDAVDLNFCIIDAGHFNTEKIFAPHLAKSISKEFPEIDIIYPSLEIDPFIYY